MLLFDDLGSWKWVSFALFSLISQPNPTQPRPPQKKNCSPFLPPLFLIPPPHGPFPRNLPPPPSPPPYPLFPPAEIFFFHFPLTENPATSLSDLDRVEKAGRMSYGWFVCPLEPPPPQNKIRGKEMCQGGKEKEKGGGRQ